MQQQRLPGRCKADLRRQRNDADATCRSPEAKPMAILPVTTRRASATCCGRTSRKQSITGTQQSAARSAERALDRQAHQPAQRRSRAAPRSHSSSARRWSSARPMRTNLKQAGTQLGQVDSSLGESHRPAATGAIRSLRPTSARMSLPTPAKRGGRRRQHLQPASDAGQQAVRRRVSLWRRPRDRCAVRGSERRRQIRRLRAQVCKTSTMKTPSCRSWSMAEVFGALSTRVEGRADLTPAISNVHAPVRSARRRRRRGAPGLDPDSNGTTTAMVDLSARRHDRRRDQRASTPPASAASPLRSRQMVSACSSAPGRPTTSPSPKLAAERRRPTWAFKLVHGAGAGVALDGSSLQAHVTPLTPLASLNGGAGIDLTSGIQITNGLSTTVAISSPPLRANATVEDLLNAINGSGHRACVPRSTPRERASTS